MIVSFGAVYEAFSATRGPIVAVMRNRVKGHIAADFDFVTSVFILVRLYGDLLSMQRRDDRARRALFGHAHVIPAAGLEVPDARDGGRDDEGDVHAAEVGDVAHDERRDGVAQGVDDEDVHGKGHRAH